MIIRHKATKREYPVTEEQFNAIMARHNAGSAYEIVQDNPPPQPKEIKETAKFAKAKKTLGFDNDGHSNNDAQIPDSDAGEEQ